MEFEEFVWKVEVARRHIETFLERKTDVKYFKGLSITDDEDVVYAAIETILEEEDVIDRKDIEKVEEIVKRYGIQVNDIYFTTDEKGKPRFVIRVRYEGTLE